VARLDAKWYNFFQRGQKWYHFWQDTPEVPVPVVPVGNGGGGYIRRTIKKEDPVYDDDLLPILKAFVENCVE